MKKVFLLLSMLMIGSYLVAQDGEIKMGGDGDYKEGGVVSPIMEAAFVGVAGLNMDKTNWATRVYSEKGPRHYGEDIERIKLRKNALKTPSTLEDNPQEKESGVIIPIVEQDFDANWMLNGTPPDDALAVSDGGKIVTCNNDGIEYYESSGQFIGAQFWDDFFNNPNLTGSIFDPRIEYDSGSDRFVMVVLHGSNASTSRVLVCFSNSNDPTDGWSYYQLTGDPTNSGNWFDYPSLAIGTNEVYITGNLFDRNDNFSEAIIYQINKLSGYRGQTLQFQHWSGLDRTGFSAFTLVPAVYGQSGNYGPGIYLVSNSPGGADQIRFWDLTNDIGQNPQLRVQNISVNAYEASGDAFQLNSQDRLQTGGCRIQDAFYLNQKLHFVFAKDIGDGWSGISYNRLDVNDLTIQEASFGLQGSFDYCYPSLTSFSSAVEDEAAMICFLRSSSSIFPEVRVVSIDENLDWSNSVQVKSGDNHVDIVSGDERWGDYTSMSRQQNAGSPTVWLSGSYGGDIPQRSRTNTYKTRIARIGGESTSTGSNTDPVFDAVVFPNPAYEEFNFSFALLEAEMIEIVIHDHLGRVVKPLFKDHLKKGNHILKFNQNVLQAGMYHIVIKNKEKILVNENLIIRS